MASVASITGRRSSQGGVGSRGQRETCDETGEERRSSSQEPHLTSHFACGFGCLSAVIAASLLSTLFLFLGAAVPPEKETASESSAPLEKDFCHLRITPPWAFSLSLLGSAAFVGAVLMPHCFGFFCKALIFPLVKRRSLRKTLSFPKCGTCEEKATQLVCPACGAWSLRLLFLNLFKTLLETDSGSAFVIAERALSLSGFCGACFWLFLLIVDVNRPVGRGDDSSPPALVFNETVLRCLGIAHSLDDGVSVQTPARTVLRVSLLLYGPSVCLAVGEKAAAFVFKEQRGKASFGGRRDRRTIMKELLSFLRCLLFAPVFEEFFFRALLNVLFLSATDSELAAVLWSSALFALAHLHPALVKALAVKALASHSQCQCGARRECTVCVARREDEAAHEVTVLLQKRGVIQLEKDKNASEIDWKKKVNSSSAFAFSLLRPHAVQVAQTFIFGCLASSFYLRFRKAKPGLKTADGGLLGAIFFHSVCNLGGLPTFSFMRSDSPLYRQRKLLLLLQVFAAAAAASEIL